MSTPGGELPQVPQSQVNLDKLHDQGQEGRETVTNLSLGALTHPGQEVQTEKYARVDDTLFKSGLLDKKGVLDLSKATASEICKNPQLCQAIENHVTARVTQLTSLPNPKIEDLQGLHNQIAQYVLKAGTWRDALMTQLENKTGLLEEPNLNNLM